MPVFSGLALADAEYCSAGPCPEKRKKVVAAVLSKNNGERVLAIVFLMIVDVFTRC
jgi:hypothetical protein